MNADRLKTTSVKQRLGIQKTNARKASQSDVKTRLGNVRFNSSPAKPLLSIPKQKQRSMIKSRLSGAKLTRNSDELEPHRVKISTGDVVKGMRSDQILLQRKKINANPPIRRNISSETRFQRREPYQSDRNRLSSGSISGITKQIRNDRVMKSSVSVRPAQRLMSRSSSSSSAPRSKVVRPFQSSSSRYESSRLKKVVERRYDTSSDEESPSPPPPPREPLKKLKINIMNEHYIPDQHIYVSDNSGNESDSSLTEAQLESMKQMLLRDVKKKKAMQAQKSGMSSPMKHVPKVHTQVLDSLIQKEIAVLQGKPLSDKTGSGSGVKNFKMQPSVSRKALTERFKLDSDSPMEID